jgi:hypothetical protein
MSDRAQVTVAVLAIVLGAVVLQLTDRLAPERQIVVTVHFAQ